MALTENKKVSIGDIYFGSIEAKHDLIGATPEVQQQFEDSYVKPQSISYDDFIKGNKFIVHGVKGTGKTALLHYLSIQAKKSDVDTKFLLFSKDVTEDDRKNLSKAAGFSLTEYNSRQIDQDFEAVWLWYFHRHVAQTLTEKDDSSSKEKVDYLRYVEHVSGDKENSWQTKLWRLLPRFRNGRIEIKGKVPVGEASISGDFEHRGEYHQISLTKAAERANDLLEKIPKINTKHIIFVDELELSLSRTVDFVRDGRVISGLVRAAAHINEIFRTTKSSLKIICAVRSEVLRSSHVSGDEINKIVFDFGVPIRWNYSFDDENHPLLKIVENRVYTSIRTIDPSFHVGDSWSKLFPPSIQGRRFKHWVLEKTWYRPRDIVRLFTICRDFDKESFSFSQNSFEQTARDYSNSCWTEISEELRASFTSEETEAVKTLFTGLENKPLPFIQLEDFFKKKSVNNPDIKNIIESRTIHNLLEDFFRVGIIGNEHRLKSSGQIKFLHNWYFRDGDHLLFDRNISVHRGLRHTFRMISS